MQKSGARCRRQRPVRETGSALFKAKNLSNAEQNARCPSRFNHLPALVGIHSHRLFAEHWLARSNRSQDILQVADIGSGDEHGIDFGAAAEFFGGSKHMRNPIIRGGLARLVLVAPGKRRPLCNP